MLARAVKPRPRRPEPDPDPVKLFVRLAECRDIRRARKLDRAIAARLALSAQRLQSYDRVHGLSHRIGRS